MKLLRFNQWSNKSILTESMIQLGNVNNSSMYTNLKTKEIIGTDLISKSLLDDIAEAAKDAGVRVYVTCAISDHPKPKDKNRDGRPDYTSRHDLGQAVDIALIGFETTDWSRIPGSNGSNKYSQNRVPEFVEAGNALAEKLIGRGYKLVTQDTDLRNRFSKYLSSGEGPDKCILWRGDFGSGGNHYNHMHISNTSGSSSPYQQPDIVMTSDSSDKKSLIDRFMDFFSPDEQEEVSTESPISGTNKLEVENATIFVPKDIDGDNEIPFLIVYPYSNNPELFIRIINENFSEWFDKCGFIFVKDYSTSCEDLIGELETNQIGIGKTTLIFGNEVLDENLMYGLQDLRNLENIILINPQPDNDLIESLQPVADDVNIYVTYRIDLEGDSELNKQRLKFIDNLKSMVLSQVDVDKKDFIESNFKQLKGISDEELPKESLKYLNSKIEESLR